MKVPAAILRKLITSLLEEEIRKVKGGYKVYPKKPQKGSKVRKALSKKPMSYKKALKQLRAVERSKALGEEQERLSFAKDHEYGVNLIPHAKKDKSYDDIIGHT